MGSKKNAILMFKGVICNKTERLQICDVLTFIGIGNLETMSRFRAIWQASLNATKKGIAPSSFICLSYFFGSRIFSFWCHFLGLVIFFFDMNRSDDVEGWRSGSSHREMYFQLQFERRAKIVAFICRFWIWRYGRTEFFSPLRCVCIESNAV